MENFIFCAAFETFTETQKVHQIGKTLMWFSWKNDGWQTNTANIYEGDSFITKWFVPYLYLHSHKEFPLEEKLGPVFFASLQS